ncbi:MAG: hypothetical protein AVDCRST_MAG04-3962, partial [uncultured Acetobacteraceae bacterium]
AGTQLGRGGDRRRDPRRRPPVPRLRRAEQRPRGAGGRRGRHAVDRPVRPHRRSLQRRRRPHRRGARRHRHRHADRAADVQRGAHHAGGRRPALAGGHVRRGHVRGVAGRPLRVAGAGRQRPRAGRRRSDHADAGLGEPGGAPRALHLLRHPDQLQRPEPAGAEPAGTIGRERERHAAM